MANNQNFFNRKLDNQVYIIEQGLGLSDSGDELAGASQPIILDATTDFSKKFSAQVTTNPVGDNTDVSDNYRVMPPTLSFSGVISNDVVNFYPWLNSTQSDTRAQGYVERLQKIIEQKLLVECYMPDGLRTKNCMITEADIRRDKDWSNGFYVDITLKRIDIVTGSVTSKPSDETADGLEDTNQSGSKTTREYSPKEQNPIVTKSTYNSSNTTAVTQ